MDVGNPSNFVRILEIFDQQIDDLKKLVSSESVSDDETRATLKKVKEEFNYLLDPHGAVGYYALEEYLQQHPGNKGMVVETAHPVKFFDVVEPIIGEPIAIPEVVKQQLQLEKKALLMENNSEALREFLMKI
jgi:threonine synthase